MRKLFFLLVCLLALWPGVAVGQTTITAPLSAHFPYQRWVEEAKAPTPSRTVTIVEDANDCAGVGCTDGTTIWIAPWIPAKPTFFHELGHIFAHEHPDIAEFTNERFAMVYSLCARLARIDPNWGYTAGEGLINGTRLKQRCEALRHFEFEAGR